MASLITAVLAFLGPVSSAVKGFINLEELGRAFVAALVATGTVSGAVAGVEGDLSNILTPQAYQVAVFFGTLAADLFRRLNHGAPVERRPRY